MFERVKEKVLDGRFQPVGGSWVENDSNMPSGEALVRQFLFGQRYFETRFGKRCDTAWLPDSFGLTGALPQLIRGAGSFEALILFSQKLILMLMNSRNELFLYTKVVLVSSYLLSIDLHVIYVYSIGITSTYSLIPPSTG